MPLMNPPKFYDLGGIRAKLSFVFGARGLLARGQQTGRPFRLLTDLGEMIVLPARFANEIRNDPRLSFSEVIVQVCMESHVYILCRERWKKKKSLSEKSVFFCRERESVCVCVGFSWMDGDGIFWLGPFV